LFKSSRCNHRHRTTGRPLAVPIRGLIGLVDRYVTGGKVYGYDNVRADGAWIARPSPRRADGVRGLARGAPGCGVGHRCPAPARPETPTAPVILNEDSLGPLILAGSADASRSGSGHQYEGL